MDTPHPSALNGIKMLTAALTYAARHWPVFPLAGKVPRMKDGHGWKDATTDVTQLTAWWDQWPMAGIGLATGAASGVFVLDVDPDKGGRESLHELEHLYSPLPDTVQSLTGGGGVHYFFRMPTNGAPIRLSAGRLGAGLDIRGDGGYVVLPPSPHPTGKRYEWELSSHPDDTAVADAPPWLLALLADAARPGRSPGEAIPEGVRETTLFSLAGAMRRQGAQEDTIYAALAAENVACVPPLPDEALQRMARSAMRYTPAPDPSRHWTANTPYTAAPAWRAQLLTKKNGDPTMNITNIGLILSQHPAWQGKFWWDAVRARPMMDEAPLTQEDITRIGQWLGTQERMGIASTHALEQCIVTLCHEHPRDLLQTWLNTVPPWDGIPRLNDWLSDVAGVTKDAYGMAVSRILPLSMVARALDPGCLYRYVVILEGPENTGKSSLVRAMASPEWYVELSMGLETKESHMMLQGAWVAEMPELDSLTRTEETRLKAFITLRDDTWIPKYSNFKMSNPRRTIFVGTTNDESYLKGQTGNTRFLPIKTQEIDVPAFGAMRTQLFAEALQEYYGDPQHWWSLPQDALIQATIERENRRVVNVYEDELAEWLGPRQETAWSEIASHFLRLRSPAEWKDRSLQMQVATALKAIGFVRRQVWRDGTNRRIWERQRT